jgi:Ca2+-binding EF-hand superfamily protein
MIGEVDSKGTGEIDLDDFIKMVSVQLGELPGEASS